MAQVTPLRSPKVPSTINQREPLHNFDEQLGRVVHDDTFITPSFEMGRLVKEIKNKNLNKLTAKDYLNENMFKYLEKSMSERLRRSIL